MININKKYLFHIKTVKIKRVTLVVMTCFFAFVAIGLLSFIVSSVYDVIINFSPSTFILEGMIQLMTVVFSLFTLIPLLLVIYKLNKLAKRQSHLINRLINNNTDTDTVTIIHVSPVSSRDGNPYRYITAQVRHSDLSVVRYRTNYRDAIFLIPGNQVEIEYLKNYERIISTQFTETYKDYGYLGTTRR